MIFRGGPLVNDNTLTVTMIMNNDARTTTDLMEDGIAVLNFVPNGSILVVFCSENKRDQFCMRQMHD